MNKHQLIRLTKIHENPKQTEQRIDNIQEEYKEQKSHNEIINLKLRLISPSQKGLVVHP